MRPAGGGGGGCRVERTVHTPGLRILQHGAQPDKNTFIRLCLVILSGRFCCPVCAFFFKLCCCLSFSESDVTTTVLF